MLRGEWQVPEVLAAAGQQTLGGCHYYMDHEAALLWFHRRSVSAWVSDMTDWQSMDWKA